jgi:hypothetical protein
MGAMRRKRPSSSPRRLYFLFSLICAALAGLASAEETATVSFTLDFPGSEPSHYQIGVSSDGHCVYDSSGKLSPDVEDDSFHLDFSVSPQTRERIFALAKRAHYFQGDLDSKKRNLASTGAKTLAYKDAKRSSQATYNYSSVPAVGELTQLFQGLSSTLEFGRRLQYFHHYQKLALDEELKRMEDMAQQNSLEELSAVAPILQQIAEDSSVINPVRARAERLLARTAARSGR